MRVKVVSDGLFMMTKFVDAETGEPIHGITGFRIEANVDNINKGDGFVHLHLDIIDFDMEIEAEVDK